MNNFLLIGGSNIDYIGTSESKITHHASNIGSVFISYGGVMRNVAENLARLGNNFSFVTAIGNDVVGKELIKYMNELNIDLIMPESSKNSSIYLAINDASHDLYVSICDNKIIDDINIGFLESYKKEISSHEYIALDSNLSKESIDYLLTTYKKKFICECISPSKVLKYKDNLDKIYLLKGNIQEAQALINKKIFGEELIKELLHLGIKNVVVSNGDQDIYYGYNGIIDKVIIAPINDISSTLGCGDALFSGIIDKLTSGKDIKEAIEFGIKLSNLTIKCIGANSKDISIYAYEH